MTGKRLLKTLCSFMLAFIMAFVPVAEAGFVQVEAATVTLKFHYNRSDGGYDGWNIWGWAKGGNGGQLNFTGSDAFGKVATTTTSATQYGFIVRSSSDWNTCSREPGGDRFVTIPSGTIGTVHVYITSGQEEFDIYITDTDEAPVEPTSAYITAENQIEVTFTDTPSDVTVDTAVLTDDTSSTRVEINSIDVDGVKAIITTSENLSIGNSYTFKKSSEATKEVKAAIDFNGNYFENNYTYDGNDLGCTYTQEDTTFKVWAPTASEVSLRLFATGTDSEEGAADLGSYLMTKVDKGVWTATIEGDLKNVYYLYSVTVGGKTNLAMDPYAKAGCTVADNPSQSSNLSGQRSMVVDLDSTDPTGWSENDKTVELINPTDAIIYETSVRDFSINENSGVSKEYRGKYLAFTQSGTTLNGEGKIKTGLDYIEELGVTHVQIMPSYDFSGTNEVTMAKYNWGYNPVNYNIPEGAFATNPYDGNVRVNEYKQMVQAMHDRGIGVVMDVVYNHVNNANTFSYELIVPGYFFRGSNGSGCGNDVASERTMVRKFIVDSVAYWAEEYHLDGFRFDLVGLLDVDTLNGVREAVDKINPDALIYGEGWSMPTSTTKEVDLATQYNTDKMPGVGVFNDVIRDATGGNNNPSKGYATGNALYNLEGLKWSLRANTPFTNDPTQLINYVSCHDNYTLWDKICATNSSLNEQTKIKMNNLAASIIMTSQGIPFFLSGEEFLRTKNGNHNSYNSTDKVNWMDWSRADTYSDVVDYYKGLVELRKAYPEFRMSTYEETADNISYLTAGSNILAYQISSDSDAYSGIVVAFNPNASTKLLTLPEGEWKVVVNDEDAGSAALSKVSGTLNMNGYSAYVLVQGSTTANTGKTEIVEATFDVDDSKCVYTGSEVKPVVTNVKVGATTLTEGVDYELEYNNNVSVGAATVKIVGIGNYAGKASKTFNIKKANSTLAISCGNVTYGTAVEPKVTTNTSNGKVTYSYKKYGAADSTYTTTKPVDVGTYVVRAVSAATSTHNSATVTATFKITKKYVNKATVTGIVSQKTYTGKNIKQSGIVVKLDGKTLVNGKDYSISYKNNKKVGKATVTITGKGNYTGKINKKFNIVLGKTLKVNAKAGKKRVTLTWQKVKGAGGYKVYMATKKNGKYKVVKTLTSGSKVKFTKAKLTKNKKYYFKVRAYKKVNGKIQYGKYSAIKPVTAK